MSKVSGKSSSAQCAAFLKKKQERCSVQFKTQTKEAKDAKEAKEIKVELKFSDEAEARAASTIEPSGRHLQLNYFECDSSCLGI